jgi:ribonucrease Y
MNDIGAGIILAVVGTIIGFFGARLLLNIQRKNKVNDLNAQVDLEVKEAKLNAKRILDDAELKAEKLLDQSEVKND